MSADPRPNPGRCPPEAAGKRIAGRLRNGSGFGSKPVSPTAPLGWAADTTDWRLTGSPFDLLEYRVLG